MEFYEEEIRMDIYTNRSDEFENWVYKMATNDDDFMTYIKSFEIEEEWYPDIINPYLYTEYIINNVMKASCYEYNQFVDIANTVIDSVDEQDFDISQMTVFEFRNIVRYATIINYE